MFGHHCIICGFDFEAVYGPVAANSIQVHHLELLSRADGGREVNPRRDLRPVCANCHAVLHLRTLPYTVEEIQTFLEIRSIWNGKVELFEGDVFIESLTIVLARAPRLALVRFHLQVL